MESYDSPPDGALRRMGADPPLIPRSIPNANRGGGLPAHEALDLAPAERYGASMGECPHNEARLPAAPELNNQAGMQCVGECHVPPQ